MFSLCESMQWSHLPLPGGLYEQDPELLDGFQLIFAERGAWEEEEKKRNEAEQKKNSARSQQRSRASRGRH